MRLMHPAEPKPAEFLQEQPFGQVPSYNEGDVHLFESGAILVHVGGKDERLLPRDPNGRGRAIGWVFAALNSVEPILAEYAVLDMFHAGQEWAKLRKPSAEEALRKRLTQLSEIGRAHV